MKIRSDKIRKIIKEIEEVTSILEVAEAEHSEALKQVHPAFIEGARNLIHYRTLRSMDLKKLHKRLSYLGLSILGSTESHVMASLLNIRHFLLALIQNQDEPTLQKHTSIKSSVKQQKKHAKDLLGFRSKSRRVRIMLTLPTKAAYHYELVHNLVDSGMNIARINCAHDNREIWEMMILNLNRANEALNKKCRLFMDLSGPKIRTTSLGQGVKVRKFRPQRNESGEVIHPAHIEMVPILTVNSPNEIPVNTEWLKSLTEGDHIRFKDARKKQRKLTVKTIFSDRVIATCNKTSYIKTGCRFKTISTGKKCKVGELTETGKAILLRKNDLIRVVKDQIEMQQAVINKHGEIVTHAMISCSTPDIFDLVKPGEKILFDDGKISGIIRNRTESEILVEITHAKTRGTKLRADKGINVPDSNLNFHGLTSKDKEDLRFIVQHADAVNVSFIKSGSDVAELYTELDRLDAAKDFGVVLKIENQQAFKNLSDILLTGMKRYPLGIMIARGDLAIEAGWAALPRIQNEILRLCDSAYVPTIWATQVLENMAKKGIPSRSELTDVGSSLKADCVMLNKGNYILDALHLLHSILSGMNSYRDKDEMLYETMEANG